jgi:hypothetical protein
VVHHGRDRLLPAHATSYRAGAITAPLNRGYHDPTPK